MTTEMSVCISVADMRAIVDELDKHLKSKAFESSNFGIHILSANTDTCAIQLTQIGDEDGVFKNHDCVTNYVIYSFELTAIVFSTLDY